MAENGEIISQNGKATDQGRMLVVFLLVCEILDKSVSQRHGDHCRSKYKMYIEAEVGVMR